MLAFGEDVKVGKVFEGGVFAGGDWKAERLVDRRSGKKGWIECLTVVECVCLVRFIQPHARITSLPDGPYAVDHGVMEVESWVVGGAPQIRHVAADGLVPCGMHAVECFKGTLK